jgi:hypothetical protein
MTNKLFLVAIAFLLFLGALLVLVKLTFRPRHL